MKAIVYEKYGTPNALKLRDIPKPVPADGEVLVKVHAAAVNSWDWDLLTGKPYAYRVWSGLLKPKRTILGADIAGRIEAIGTNVNRLKLGDAVFGDISLSGFGGFAEYVCAPEKILAIKPSHMSFEQASAIPQAGFLALQGLRKKKDLGPDHKVLINGGGGGAGTFAIQIAKAFGAEVTGVDHTAKLETMRAAGADHVLDYTTGDFTKTGKLYDLILDVVTSRSVFDYARALSPTGVFVMVGGTVSAGFLVPILGSLISKMGTKKICLLMWRPNVSDLDHMAGLFEAGTMLPVIDRCYPLEETAAALRHLGDGHVKGKIVISVDPSG